MRVTAIVFWPFRWVGGLVRSHREGLGAWSSLVTVVSFPLIVIGLYVGYHQIRGILVRPELELEFVRPSPLEYKIVSVSGRTAEDVVVEAYMLDIDAKSELPPYLRKCDYVTRPVKRGPFALFDGRRLNGVEGHGYFGIIKVACKDCKELRTYLLYVKHGSKTGAFYAEAHRTDEFRLDRSRLFSEPEKYLEELVPKPRRTYIIHD